MCLNTQFTDFLLVFHWPLLCRYGAAQGVDSVFHDGQFFCFG